MAKDLFRGSWRCVLFAIYFTCLSEVAIAQSTPPPGVICVVSAGNRNAPLAPDGSYAVFGIRGDFGVVRARVTCSDGSVGQSAAQFTNPLTPSSLALGPIQFGTLSPVPVALALSAPTPKYRANLTSDVDGDRPHRHYSKCHSPLRRHNLYDL